MKKAFASLPASGTTFCFRADRACDTARSLKWLTDPERPDGPKGPLGFTMSADMTADLHTVCAAVAICPGDWPEPAAALRWHWQKAGTIEGVHDITKTAVPPCGRFGANAAWSRLSILTMSSAR